MEEHIAAKMFPVDVGDTFLDVQDGEEQESEENDSSGEDESFPFNLFVQ